jgi:Zn-dependent metalloprotease
MTRFTLLQRAVLAAIASLAAVGAQAKMPTADHPAVQRALAHLNGPAAASAQVAAGDSFVARDLVTDADGSEHVRFNRMHKGLRVIGGDFVLHGAPNGSFREVSISMAARINVDVTKTPVPSRDVGPLALAAFPHADGRVDSQSLVIYARDSQPRLAWDVLVKGMRAGGVPSKLHLIIGAQGKVIDSWDDIQTADDVGTGKTLYLGDLQIHDVKKKGGKKFTLTDKTRGGHYVVDMLNTQSQEVLFTDKNNVWGNNTESDRSTVAADAQFGQNMTWDYYKNVHGRNGIYDDGDGGYSRVHLGVNVDNAFWDFNGCRCMTYGDGNFFTPLVSLDVAGHEMSHGVTEATAGLIYGGESGGLNEGTSDIFGSMVEYYANNAKDPGDYLIGEVISPPGQWLRNMVNPSQDGASADCWYSGVGNIDVHYSSGVTNHFYYLLAEGTTNGSPSKTCIAGNTRVASGNGSVTGIGRAKAEKIWYRALSVYMTASETFAKARTDTVKAATDLYGAGSPEVNAVNAAWTAVNRP